MDDIDRAGRKVGARRTATGIRSRRGYWCRLAVIAAAGVCRWSDPVREPDALPGLPIRAGDQQDRLPTHRQVGTMITTGGGRWGC